MYDKYDNECRVKYGDKVVILFQTVAGDNVQDHDTFQMRYLDTLDFKCVQRGQFYDIIPWLLIQKYVVVIVEQCELTAVHMPVQTSLSLPPLLQ